MKTTTVNQLIERLSTYDPETPVVFAYPAKDYWGGVLAGEIRVVEFSVAAWSGYHRAFRLPALEDRPISADTEDESTDSVGVLVLS